MTNRDSLEPWAPQLRLLRVVTWLLAVAVAPNPVAGQDRPLAVDLVEVYRVGGLDAPPWAFFERREPTGFDVAGNLYVLDTRAPQVVVVDPRGELVRTVGRKGEGPGEFDVAERLFVWRDGRFVVGGPRAGGLPGLRPERGTRTVRQDGRGRGPPGVHRRDEIGDARGPRRRRPDRPGNAISNGGGVGRDRGAGRVDRRSAGYAGGGGR